MQPFMKTLWGIALLVVGLGALYFGIGELVRIIHTLIVFPQSATLSTALMGLIPLGIGLLGLSAMFYTYRPLKNRKPQRAQTIGLAVGIIGLVLYLPTTALASFITGHILSNHGYVREVLFDSGRSPYEQIRWSK